MWGSTSGEGTCRWTFTPGMSTIGRRRIITARTDGIDGLRLLRGDGTATMGLRRSTTMNTAARIIAGIIGTVIVGNRSVLIEPKEGAKSSGSRTALKKISPVPALGRILGRSGEIDVRFLISASAWLF